MTAPDRRARIEDLFEAALDQPDRDRAEWVEAECAGDPDLLAEVQALLAAHELADRIFRPGGATAAGTLVGPYRILQELGRGGMGTVYLAERADGHFRRRVALKVVESVSADDPVYQRFLAERQILAALDHAFIARLLDGGLAEDGRPFLALEYVEGLPITTYCQRHGLGIRDRLRLFMDVCEAVQHAHQNLVLHRDLKPSNILVTAAGEVRLLDFGIAKLLNPTLAGIESPVTRQDLRAMTPEYASPEQVRGEALTTASDIYSLGVLLYELLAGQPPYSLPSVPAEILEVVCERDPQPPSAHGPRELRGDLDSITMMALRKESGRRYASAALMGQDIGRYLEGLPVLAHRGGHRYRLARLVRRHRVAAASMTLVAASIGVGAGVALWQARVADTERARAEAARAAAENALGESQEVTAFLMGLFEAGEDEAFPLPEHVTARDLLQRGAARADDLAGRPALQARMLDVIGQIYWHLGRYDDASLLLERAIVIRRDLGADAVQDLASSLIHLAWVHRSRGEYEAARPLVEEALDIRRATLPLNHHEVADAIYQLGRTTPVRREAEALYAEALAMLQATGSDLQRQVGLLQGLSTFARRDGRLEDAVRYDRAALALAVEVFGPADHRTGYAMVHLGDQVRDIEENLEEAEWLYRGGLDLISRRFGQDHVNLVHGLGSLAWLKALDQDEAEAERLYRRVLEIRLAAVGPENPASASSMSVLAGSLERQGRLAEAEALTREAVAIYHRVLGPDHWGAAASLARLGSILSRQNRFSEADSAYRQAVAIQVGRSERLVATAETRRQYGRALTLRGEWEAAEDQLLESLRMLETELGPDHPNTRESRRALSELYTAKGDTVAAERYRVPPGRFVAY